MSLHPEHDRQVHLPAPAPEPGPALLDALETRDAQQLQSRSAMAKTRAVIIAMMNAAIAENPSNPERGVRRALSEHRAGISTIVAQYGADKVHKILPAEKFPEALRRGRQLHKEHYDPVYEVARRNTLNEDNNTRLSFIVSNCLSHDYNDPIPVSSDFEDHLKAGRVESYADALRFGADVQLLQRILDLADELGLTSATLSRAMSPAFQESGVLQLIGIMQDKVSFLEIAVFCATYARRHGIRQENPLTLPAEEARRFIREFDKQGNLRPDARAEYFGASDERFGDRANEARLLLECYLGEIESTLRFRSMVRKRPELIFPVRRLSAGAVRTVPRPDVT